MNYYLNTHMISGGIKVPDGQGPCTIRVIITIRPGYRVVFTGSCRPRIKGFQAAPGNGNGSEWDSPSGPVAWQEPGHATIVSVNAMSPLLLVIHVIYQFKL
jgi:hypothetical protein